MTRAELDQTIAELIKLKKDGHFRAFWGTFDQSVNLMASGEVVIQPMWSPAVTTIRTRGIACSYVPLKVGDFFVVRTMSGGQSGSVMSGMMNQGIIEQTASERDVFAAPRRPYVARFMSAQNVLGGVVDGVRDGVTMLTGGFAVPTRDLPLKPGDQAQFSLRRDLCRILRDQTLPDHNTVTGIVDAIEYQGSFVKIAVTGIGPGEFVVHDPEAAYFKAPVQRGDTVRVVWATADSRLLEPDFAPSTDTAVFGEHKGEPVENRTSGRHEHQKPCWPKARTAGPACAMICWP